MRKMDSYSYAAWIKAPDLVEGNCNLAFQVLLHHNSFCLRLPSISQGILTSAHNHVRKAISSFLILWVGPKWTVHEETRMGNMDLTLSKVQATVEVDAGKSSGVDAAGECDLQRWQPDWVAIPYAHKQNRHH